MAVPICTLGCFALGLDAFELSTVLALPLIATLVFAYRFDFTNAWVAFTIPWLIVLLFSTLDISEFSRIVAPETVGIVMLGLVVGLILIPPSRPTVMGFDPFKVNRTAFGALFGVFVGFTVLNIALAGFVPLLQAVSTGDSGYSDFGLRGLYGLYNAFANAFGITAFYLWQRDGKQLYRNAFWMVVVVFILFVTRQNLVSLAVECFAIHNLCVRRSPRWLLVGGAAAALVAFALLGDLRISGGDGIAELAQIRANLLWLPHSIMWLYSYSYFNILNLDNVATTFVQPALDGLSLTQLIPSFLRPEGNLNDADLIEVAAFNVTSYASPVFRDLGYIGIAAVVGLFALLTRTCLLIAQRRNYFLALTAYAVLFFCFAFSFFVNFWFYLPVIFQLVFLCLFSRVIRIRTPRRKSAYRQARNTRFDTPVSDIR